MKKALLAGTIIIIALIAVFFIRSSDQGYEQQKELPKTDDTTKKNIETTKNNNTEKPTEQKEEETKKSNGIPLSEIQKHEDKEDCWVIYENKVYDITSYLPKHPGTAARITPYCGTTEFQEAFEKQHKKSKVNLLMKVGTFMGDFDIIGSVQQ